MSASNFDYDVAIIGYGPTSVVAANFLGAAGLKVVVFERDKDLYSRARAVTVDGTTMRIFQSLGLDETVKEDMDVTPFLRWKTYAGKEFMRIKPGGGNWGHANAYMIYQPSMEAKLRKGTERYKNVTIKFGFEVSGMTQDADGVDVVFAPVGKDTSSTVRVKYVIGADGGSSQTRKLIGSVAKGETRERTWIVIDAKVKKPWPEHDILTFWSDADRPAVDMPLTMVHHRWELPLGDKTRKEDFESEAQIWELLSTFGVTNENIETTHHAFYNHHIRMVDKWRNGRILLAGDAAHLMPPWAGQGMQSGIRDAYSLAWRLRAILKFGADDSLLDTYQVERQPHVEAMTQSAISLGSLIEAKKGPAQVIRNLMMPILSKSPKFANSLAVSPDAKSGWFAGKPEKKNPLGQMLPQPHVTLKSGKSVPFDSIYGIDFAVIGYDTDPAATSGADAWKKLGAAYVTVRPAGTTATHDNEVVDETGEIGAWMTARGASVIALRPDRLVVASNNTSLAIPA